MLSVTDGGSLTRALNSALDPRFKRLLTERRDQLGVDITDLAHFVIVQPADGDQRLSRPSASIPS